MKFSAGDRIAVYGVTLHVNGAGEKSLPGWRVIGTVTSIENSSVLTFFETDRGLQNFANIRQCRKLIKKKKEKTPTEKLQALYDSEINFRIECFWDDGFEWFLGAKCNGLLVRGEVTVQDIDTTIDDLWHFAKIHFPDAKCFKEKE